MWFKGEQKEKAKALLARSDPTWLHFLLLLQLSPIVCCFFGKQSLPGTYMHHVVMIILPTPRCV